MIHKYNNTPYVQKSNVITWVNRIITTVFIVLIIALSCFLVNQIKENVTVSVTHIDESHNRNTSRGYESAEKFVFEGHHYIRFVYSSRYDSPESCVVHDPNCPLCKH